MVPALIIPVHNRRTVTLSCLRHLARIGALERFEAIVIDDGSTDGTGAAVQAEFPHAIVLGGDGSLWWTGAIALGSAHAFARGAPAAIWLNDDCRPEHGALELLLASVLADRLSIAGATCRNARTGARLATGFVGRRAVAANLGERRPVHGLSGYCIAVPRDVWQRTGPPDARRFPHYAGDTAYTLRAHQLGCRVELLGDACVQVTDYHPEPATPTELRDPRRTWRDNYRAIFCATKSPLRLATHWHLLRLKYGPLAGTVIATARFAVWHVRFLSVL